MPADPFEPGQAVYATLAFVCYLPIQIWLVLSVSRGNRGWPQRLGLAIMAVVIFAVMPLVGVGWVGIIDVLCALTLAIPPPPWSFLTFCALIFAPTALTSAFGRPAWALYFTLGILLYCLPLAVGIWIINLARQVQLARLDLAEQSVVREPMRIDRALSHPWGTGLKPLSTPGDRAPKLCPTYQVTAAR